MAEPEKKKGGRPKKPDDPLSGKMIERGKCAECGGAVALTVNRGGIVYYNCRQPDMKSEFGGNCSHQVRYGRHRSNQMIEEYKNPKPQPEKIEHDRKPKQPARREDANFLGL